MEGRITLRNAVIVGLVLVSGVLLTWLVMLPEVQAQECPNPRLIDEITGSGDQDSPPFETTTDSFRISYDITTSSPDAPFFLNVESTDRSIGPTGNVSRQGSGTGETFANVPPGRYSLKIITGGGTEYTVKVEECGEGGAADPNEGKGGEGTTKDQSKVRPSPPKSPPPPPKIPPPPPPKAPPFKAGGAEDGPVPLMKGGSCPREFPERHGNACHAVR